MQGWALTSSHCDFRPLGEVGEELHGLAMRRGLRFGTVVFLTTFAVNVAAVALTSNGDVRWLVSGVVAAVTPIALTLMYRRELSR